MQNLDTTAEELFNKIRGRFPSITIGDAEGNVTNEPKLGRYFDFDFVNEGRPIGKVSVSLDEKNVAVVYGGDLVATESDIAKKGWYDFLKELRMFARKRTLEFDTRDITKSNLDQRDYKFLAKNRDGDNGMNESKLYGTSRQSYQDFDGARLMIKHTEGVDQEASAGRTRKIGAIYVESSEGERFKYPFKHLTGARAMARHVSEGGVPHDDFGKHIVSMSEEMNKLRKFKSYMGRSAVMAESLAEYVDVVKQRVGTIKKTLESLQKPSYYKETFEAFETPVLEDVPTDVAENWIDQLTIKQFNEELADVFPYIYKLVSEANKAEELGPLDLQGYTVHEVAGPKDCWDGYKKDGTQAGTGKNKGKRVNKCVPEDAELEQGFEEMMGQFAEGETNEEVEVSDEMRSQISDWIDKFSKYKGGNGDTLPEGYMQWALNSGIATDFFEENEVDAFNKKKGYDADSQTEEWTDEDHDDFTDNTSGASPITSACLKMLNKITGDDFIEDNAHIIDAVMHGDGNESTNEAQEGQVGTMTLFVTDQDGGEHEAEVQVKIVNGKPEIDPNTLPGPEDQLYWDEADIEQQAMDAMKNGDIEFDEGDNDTMDVKIDKDGAISKDGGTDEKEQKTPLGEFILSYYDKEEGAFPKGETAVLTMVEKDYGEQYINPAKAFIESVYEMTERYKQAEDTNPQMDRMKELAGLR